MSKLDGIFDAIGNVFDKIKDVKDFLWNMLPLFGQLKYIFMIVGFVISLGLARMAFKFGPTKLMIGVLKKAVKSSKPQNNQPAAPTVVVLLKESESDSEDSIEDEEERDKTSE